MSEERELLLRVQKILNQKFDYYLDIEKDIEACLAKPEPEPVLYQFYQDGKWYNFINDTHYKNTVDDGGYPIRPLYTSPPSKELSDMEIHIAVGGIFYNDYSRDPSKYDIAIARAVLKAAL